MSQLEDKKAIWFYSDLGSTGAVFNETDFRTVVVSEDRFSFSDSHFKYIFLFFSSHIIWHLSLVHTRCRKRSERLVIQQLPIIKQALMQNAHLCLGLKKSLDAVMANKKYRYKDMSVKLQKDQQTANLTLKYVYDPI